LAPAWLVSMAVCAWAVLDTPITDTQLASIHTAKERPAESASQAEQAARKEPNMGRSKGKEFKGFEIMELK